MKKVECESSRMRPGMLPLAGALLLAILAGPAAGRLEACTAFFHEAPGGPIYGVNLDFLIPTEGLILVNRRGVTKTHISRGEGLGPFPWTSEYGSVTFNIAGREFAWGGMNEAGLVVTGLELRTGKYPKPDGRPAFDVGSYVQYLIDTCGSVEDVIKAQEEIRPDAGRHPANHLFVADSSGDCAVLEYIGGRLVVYRGDELPVQALSNIRYDRALWAWEHGRRKWWHPNPGASSERFAAAADRMRRFSGNDAVSYAMATLTRSVVSPYTQWNVVYDLERREVRYRSNVRSAVKVLHMDAFDFSPEASTMMLAVNAPVHGNAEEAFGEFNGLINRRVFDRHCALADLRIPAEVSRDLQRIFEGYEPQP